MAGLAICTKQSIGLTLATMVVVYKIMFIENKKQIKEYSKIIVTRVLGIIIPVTILLLYLIISGAISEFINYAILGIGTFSNSIQYSELLQNEKAEIKILAILVPITIAVMAISLIFSKILKKENIKTKEIITLLIYSLSIVIVIYPISDEIHFLIGSLVTIISLIYMISNLLKIVYNKLKIKNKLKIYKIISLFIWIILFAIILMKSMNNLYEYLKSEKNIEIEHYKGIEIQDYLKLRIKDIDRYIFQKENEGKKVYILDSEAVVYTVPINRYNKDYDMFLKGNIGKDGEDGQIKKIKQKDENVLYLIKRKDLSLNWQTPLNVIKYIRENLELIEEISIYEVYR